MEASNIQAMAAGRLPLEVNMAVQRASLNLPLTTPEVSQAERLAALATAMASLQGSGNGSHLTAAALLLVVESIDSLTSCLNGDNDFGICPAIERIGSGLDRVAHHLDGITDRLEKIEWRLAAKEVK